MNVQKSVLNFFTKKSTWSGAEQTLIALAHDFVTAVSGQMFVGMQVEIETQVDDGDRNTATIIVRYKDPNHRDYDFKKINNGILAKETVAEIYFQVSAVGRNGWKFSVTGTKNVYPHCRYGFVYDVRTSLVGFFVDKNTLKYAGLVVDPNDLDQMFWIHNGVRGASAYGHILRTHELSDYFYLDYSKEFSS